MSVPKSNSSPSMTTLAPPNHRDGSQDGQRDVDEKQTTAASPRVSSSREQATRLQDGLELLRTERLVSNREHELNRLNSRRRHPEPEDTFSVRDEKEVPKRSEGASFLNKIWVKLKEFPRLLRYFLYMLPVGVVLLIPILLGVYVFDEGTAVIGGTGGVYLLWFGIWLETMWLSLWAARVCSPKQLSSLSFPAAPECY